MDISFSTQQVVDSEEHRLLMALRDGSLNDEGLELFFQRVIESLVMEGQYLILLAYDAYDVPYRSQDGETQGGVLRDFFPTYCAACVP